MALSRVKRLFWVLAAAALVAIGVLGWWLLQVATSQEVGADLEHPSHQRSRSASPPFDGSKKGAARDEARPLSEVAPVVDGGPQALVAEEGEDREEALDAGTALLDFKRMLAKNAEAATRNVDRFCELSRKVSKVKAFAPQPKPTRDAALYLASRVDWEGGSIGSLHLPKSLTDRMASPGWMALKPGEYAGFDFTWMTELLEYDVWLMSTSGPLRDLNIKNFFEAPIPNFVSLQQWSKLRLAKGLNENDLAHASLEVRHLADLCGSTNILIGEMIRTAILGIERAMYERLGQPVPEALPSADEALAYRRTTFASMYFLFPGVPKAVREKAIACSAARCSAITEALGISGGARNVVPEAQENFEWLMNQSPCDAALADSIDKSAAATGEQLARQVEEAVSIDDLLTFDAGLP